MTLEFFLQICLCVFITLLPDLQVHIEFTEGTDKINVEGPPEEVNEAVKELEVIVKDLVSTVIGQCSTIQLVYEQIVKIDT